MSNIKEKASKGTLASIFIFIVIVNSGYSESCIRWLRPYEDERIVINGLPWYDQNDHRFIRLPLTEEQNITKSAWAESLCPSSARLRFKTSSTSLRLRIDHQHDYHRHNLSDISVAGIDLYIGPPDQMSFWMTTRPKDGTRVYEHLYFEQLSSEIREFTLYLPSYAKLAELQIGIDSGAQILPPTPYEIQKPLVFYGTSVTQNASASRGSNGFVPILGRRLNADVVNLGFSGSGKGEPIMAQLMTQIDASVYVVDSVANMDIQLMNERYEKFVRLLRNRKPDIPVVLMTKIHSAGEIQSDEAAAYDLQNQPVFETYHKLLAEGDKNIFLFDAGKIIKPGGDHPTIDGVHLTDRGFYMIADVLTPQLASILRK